MSIVSTDIKFFKSSNPNSDGGTITATQIVDGSLNNLFPDTTGDQAATGNISYRKIFVENTHSTLTLQATMLWIQQQAQDNEQIDIGLGTSNDSDGTAITYSTPLDKSSGISIGDMAPNVSQGIWIRRTTPANSLASPAASTQLRVEGNTL